MEVTALILAAGTSSRMGTPKQLLPYKGTTLLGWSIQNAQNAKIKKIVCVLGSNAEEIKDSISEYEVDLVVNKNYNAGLSSSIKAGIEYIGPSSYDAVLIMLCDQPKVNGKYLNLLIEHYQSLNDQVVASSYGSFCGVPAIFPKTQLPRLMNIENDKGARDFLNDPNSPIAILATPVDLRDIDTPIDYESLIKD